ncbi:hypothetical protein PVAP13_7NG095400 [Panicum virgatum]|uniref:Uncharacterized protein n=1 Tax=Panicum virgatum TaxID=38727 RepID=A0A8T0PV31_PANVG|nr:hypothetical protein PVAP13_7NG095400 [Panicum virgatum]
MAEGLMDELVEEILLRLPPDDPRRHRFRRGFAERHCAAPMLGFLANLRDGGEDDDCEYDFVARFVPATPFRPSHADRLDRRALDARHGRVLLTTTPWGPNLEVWDPWNAAVVCAAHGECDHLDCHRGPFLVVFLDDSGPEEMHVYVYSSEVGACSEPTYGPPSPTYGVEMVPTALYDLAKRSVSVLHLPLGFVSDFAVLTTSEDGMLGFARVGNSRLWLWSMETGPEGDATWAPKGSIELLTLLQVDAAAIVNDYVEDAWFSIALESGHVREEDCGDGHTHGVVPYTSFYIPDFHQYGLAPL